MAREKNHERKEISIAEERGEKERRERKADEQVDEGRSGRDTSDEER